MDTDHKFLSLDLETTGVDPLNDRIVSVGIVIGTRHVIYHAIEVIFQVDVEIPKASSDVHGITTEKANAEGRPREDLIEVAQMIQEDCVEKGSILVAYNASFDLTFLKSEFARIGIQQPEWDKISIVDPHLLDKTMDTYRKGSRTLSATFKHWLKEDLENAHGALTDAIATMRILFVLLERFGGSSPNLPTTVYEMLGDVRFNAVQSIIYEQKSKSLEDYFRKSGRDIEKPFDHGWPFKNGSKSTQSVVD